MKVDYTLDAAGRVIAVDKIQGPTFANLISGVKYEPFGPANNWTYSNGLTMSASFDQDYELDQLSSGSDLDWLFSYDGVGNILTIDDQVLFSNDQTFTYDDLHRLDTAAGNYGSEDFDYDANGNRTLYQGSEVYTYEANSNRLATQGNWTFTRDAVGNRTEKLNGSSHGQLYSFADNNRLIQTSTRDATGDTVVGTYTYDGRGQRLIKDADGQITHYVYGLNGELLGEYQPGGTNPTEYIFLSAQPVAMTTSTLIEPPPNYFVFEMDNDDPGTSSNGSWNTKTDSQAIDGDYRLGNKNTTSTYTWTVNNSPTHATIVEVNWVDHNSYSDSVDYTVVHAGGTTVINKSHKVDGGQWNSLGLFYGVQYVEVSAANGKTSADAVRFLTEVSGPPPSLVQKTYFIHTDHLGTPRQMTDDSQTLVWRWDSTPFGEQLADEDPDGDGTKVTLNLRFPGQYYDAETKLHYNYFRTYDPEVGRYIESDPIGLLGGLQTYNYAESNPLSFQDSFGLFPGFGILFREFDLNGSLGLGVSGHAIAWGASASLQFSVDTNGKRCLSTDVCNTIGLGMFAGGGFSFGVGSGPLCLGSNTSTGVFAEGGNGLLAAGLSTTIDGDGHISTGRGLVGPGAGVAGGIIVCRTIVFHCYN